MVNCGSKGKTTNVSQIVPVSVNRMLMVGRIPNGFIDRDNFLIISVLMILLKLEVL